MTSPSHIPEHIAVVMDGNGRWAENRNLTRVEGHQAGADAAKNLIEQCIKRGIKYLTLFAFSSENWGRPQEEIDALMTLFLDSLQSKTNELHQNKVCIKFIGNTNKFSPELREQINQSHEKTKNNEGLTLIIAVDYSGRWDLEMAFQKIAEKVKAGELNSKDINTDIISKHLQTKDIPDPDLIIRTSGEQRISNFLLWQAAYSELYFTDVLWPDFTTDEFTKALTAYTNRQRRFGLTSNQINSRE